jgi:Zn-dependent protease
VLHNVAQALIASQVGDGTAKLRGFASTEPQVHMDAFSLIWLAIFGFGIPRTIPLRMYGKKGQEAFVWLSGPLFMLIWAFVLLLVGTALTRFGGEAVTSLASGLYLGAGQSISLAVVFLFPIPPLDGARALAAVGTPEIRRSLANLEQWMSRTPFSFFLIFLVLSFTGILGFVTRPIVAFMSSLLGLIF